MLHHEHDPLYEHFRGAVNHAFRGSVFKKVVKTFDDFERYSYLNDIFEQEILPRLFEHEAQNGTDIFYEFAKSVKNHWHQIEFLDALDGVGYTLIDNVAKEIALEAVQGLDKKTFTMGYH